MRILLVEDEEGIRETLALNLELEGYEVLTLASGRDAVKTAQTQFFNLLILDIMLPDMDGLQICEQVRLTNTQTPILFLTAKDTPADRIQGLKRGADDYLTKPFHLEELLLRVQILLRRGQVSQTSIQTLDTYTFGQNQVDFNNYQAKNHAGETFILTKKETLLLKLLIERRGEVVSRNQILQTVWGYDVYPSTRTIDNFILSFRKYFETNPKEPKYFQAIRGVGYRFETM
jgi:two-component system alkaline phosphatase synthesis response regulator PhoP